MPYYALTVTLAQANTSYNLLDLVRDARPEAPALARELTITADPDNGAEVLVGDSSLSATSYGFRLAPSDSITMRTTYANVPVADIWLRSSAANQKVSVSIIEA